MFNNSNSGIDETEFITTEATVPYILPFVQTEHRNARYKFTCAGSFIFVIGIERAVCCTVIALIALVLTWLGIQHSMVVLPLSAR